MISRMGIDFECFSKQGKAVEQKQALEQEVQRQEAGMCSLIPL
jgi:hypothetical protein